MAGSEGGRGEGARVGGLFPLPFFTFFMKAEQIEKKRMEWKCVARSRQFLDGG